MKKILYGILHIHSEYSVLDSPMTINELVERAEELGCHVIALTDHGCMNGLPEFFAVCKKKNIKPVAGVEAYVDDGMDGRAHLILLAKNQAGYQAISKAVTLANKNLHVAGGMEFPVMNKALLQECFGPGSQGHGNVVITSACISGPLSRCLLSNTRLQEQIEKTRKQMSECVAPDSAPILAIQARYDEVTARYKAAKDNKEEQTRLKAVKNQIKSQMDKMKKSVKKYEILREKERDLIWALKDNLTEKTMQEAEFYRSLGEFYIELQYHGMDDEKYVAPILVKIGRELGIPFVVSNDSHYVDNEDEDKKDGDEGDKKNKDKKVGDEKDEKDEGKKVCGWKKRDYLRSLRFHRKVESTPAEKELYIKTDKELQTILEKAYPKTVVREAFDNTLAVLESCNFDYAQENNYPVYKPFTWDEPDFESAIEKGIQNRIKNYGMKWDDEHKNRLEHEVSVIKEMGFTDYFMIVRQIVVFARKIGGVPLEMVDMIPKDPREAEAFGSRYKGSAGVGPGRGSAVGSLASYLLGITELDPVVHGLYFERFLNQERVSMPDIDLDIRTELIPSVYAFLQETYGEMAVAKISTNNRKSCKDALRSAARILADDTGDNTYKKIAGQLAAHNDDFPIKHSGSKMSSQIVEIAGSINKTMFTHGIHAAGVIISNTPRLYDHIPMAWNTKNNCWVTQCEKNEAEGAGLLKMDLLKLLALSIATECISMCHDVEWDRIPFEPEVFKGIYADGYMDGVFQCESKGMQRMIKELAPENISDLTILVAAYRPGPMDYIPRMINVKKGKTNPEYVCDQLIPILSDTYSCIIYQEQVMQIFRELAGYSLGNADLVRRAMAKKKTEYLVKEEKAFIYGDEDRGIDGCLKRGITEKQAKKVFAGMIDFAKYAFNKSHALAYAVVSYRTAWLKYHFPLQYICAYLNFHQSELAKMQKDCQRLKIPIMKPDINISKTRNTEYNKSILLGFTTIRGVSTFGDNIVKERENGLFESRQDFINRVKPPKDVLEALDTACAFRNLPDTMPPPANMLLEEKRIFGALLSMGSLRNTLETLPDVEDDIEKYDAAIGGIVTRVEETVSQRGKMACIEIGTASGTRKCIIFPDAYTRFTSLPQEGSLIIARGIYKKNRDEYSLTVKTLEPAIINIYYVKRDSYVNARRGLEKCKDPFGGKVYIMEENGILTDTDMTCTEDILTLDGVKKIPGISA